MSSTVPQKFSLAFCFPPDQGSNQGLYTVFGSYVSLDHLIYNSLSIFFFFLI